MATRIQHHPSRAHLLPELLARLDGLDPQIVTDPGGKRPSSWRTYRLCLESTPPDATHLLIVQDDAQPCDRFTAAVHSAIAEKPDRIIALFVSGIGHIARRVNQARKRGDRWMEFPSTSYIPLVATVFPADVARAIPPFADSRKIPVARADDAVVGTFCRARRLTAVATLPSLVQHPSDLPSVAGYPVSRDGAHRSAAWFSQTPLCADSGVC